MQPSSSITLLPVLLFLVSASLTAQPAAAPRLDTVAIPGSGVRFVMARLPAGTLTLDEGGAGISLPGFSIGVHEVSQQEFAMFQHRERDTEASAWTEGEFSIDAVTRPSPPYTDITFGMGSADGVPAVSMTQQAALFYCYWLYTKTGQFYRLPTEAEWTYACLAGAAGSYPAGVSAGNIDKYAWHYDNSDERYHPGGEKHPNAWGVHDMLGNVAEWTIDQYAEEYSAATGDTWVRPPDKRYGRTAMGGSFDDPAGDCHCRQRRAGTVRWQQRDPQIPKSLWWNTDASFVGFRLVRPDQPMSPEEVEAFFEEAIKW